MQPTDKGPNQSRPRTPAAVLPKKLLRFLGRCKFLLLQAVFASVGPVHHGGDADAVAYHIDLITFLCIERQCQRLDRLRRAAELSK